MQPAATVQHQGSQLTRFQLDTAAGGRSSTPPPYRTVNTIECTASAALRMIEMCSFSANEPLLTWP